MTCVTAHQLIQEELDGLGREPSLESHLASCNACRAYHDDMQRLARGLEELQGTRAPAALLRRLGLASSGSAGRRWLPLGVVAAMMFLFLGLHRVPWSAPPHPTPTPALDVADGETIVAWYGIEDDDF